MAESTYYADNRPRIKQESDDKIQKMRSKLDYMLEEGEHQEYIEEHYTGNQGKLSKAEIIDEALDLLKERGLIDK